MELNLLWVIQLAPLAAFLLITVLPKALRKIAPIIAMFFALAAAVSSYKLIGSYAADSSMLPKQYIYPWLHVSDITLWFNSGINQYRLEAGFLVDNLNLLMITVVTTITFFVHLFSFYYMAEDEGRSRYFSFLSFFAFAMTGLVLSNNLAQTFIFWELVGLASYLLIGFWYEKKSAGDAARKAFVINRLADLGFYLGIILLFIITGSVSFVTMAQPGFFANIPAEMIPLLGILIFTGVMGKSAQFPFNVWLPDAMEGPTPVSALIHSATMVAAGVFLLARAFPLFAASETTLHVVLSIGAITAIIAALMATVQRDIKKVMAYSTISQLGFMVMAVGAGSTVAAMFHLTTHAFFKSLLFLTSGAFIHLFHTNDIWEIGKKGGKKATLPMITLGVGLLSLCGIPPFSGFFSKDLILEVLHHEHRNFYFLALFASFITTFYSFRLFFVLFFSKKEEAKHKHKHDNHHHHEESLILKLCSAIPLVSLAVISILVGFKGTQLFDFKLLRWLGGEETHLNMEIFLTTSILILSAITIAYFKFKNPATADTQLTNSKNPLVILFKNKFYLDDLYVILVKQVGLRFAGLLDWFDRTIINGIMVNGSSYFILNVGRIASRLQSGQLQDYMSWAFMIAAFVVFWVIKGLL